CGSRPQTSGVPVAGAKAGSMQSMSKLRKAGPSPVEVALPVVLLPGVGVGVEQHDAERAVDRGVGPQLAEVGDREVEDHRLLRRVVGTQEQAGVADARRAEA